MLDLLISNGLVCNHDSCFIADIGIKGKTIEVVGKINKSIARRTIDAKGKYVIPGLIDPHVHIKHPFRGEFSVDNPYTATISAAFGGNTTLIDFAIQWDQSKSISDTLKARKRQFLDEAIIDYAFHICPTVSSSETINAVKSMVEEGNPSFKIYMTYSKQGRMCDDGTLMNVLEQAGNHDGIVGVHAENDALCRYNDEDFKNKQLTSPKHFPQARSNIVEFEAINRVIQLNSWCNSNLYIFHLTTKEGLSYVRQAKLLGQRVFAETCAHYLALTKEYYDRKDASNFICSPPLRSIEDQKMLWEGLQSGDISIVSSDHCGFSLRQKALGQGSFLDTPNGLPGLETRLPIVFTKGVLEKKISMQKMVEVLSVNPAKIFGLFPQKGSIQPGSDADIVILDTSTAKTLSAKDLHSPVDWTPYEGMELYGFAQTVISRGEIIVFDGELKAKRGRGKFLCRKKEKVYVG